MKLQFSITHKKMLVDVHTLEVTCKTWFNAAHWPEGTRARHYITHITLQSKKQCNPWEPFTMSKLPKTARQLLEGREASVLQRVTATEVTAEN